MTRTTHFTLAAASILWLSIAPLVAQPGGRCLGRMPAYDPSTETRLEGVVERVDEVQSMRGWTGIHLLFRSGETAYELHVGPAWFVDREMGTSFAPGDELAVTGSAWTTDEESPALTARSIQRGDQTLELRDERGTPRWAGCGQGPASGG